MQNTRDGVISYLPLQKHAYFVFSANVLATGDPAGIANFLLRFLFVSLSLGEGECRQGQATKKGIVEQEMGGDIFLVREGGDLLFGGVLGESEQLYENRMNKM